MSKIRKITTVLLSAVMIVCCLTVSAFADGIPGTTKSITSEKSYSAELQKTGDVLGYKFTAGKGTLKINVSSYISALHVRVYGSDNKLVKLSKSSASKGSDSYGSGVTYCCTSSTSNKYVGTLSYEIENGTYYITFTRSQTAGRGSGEFSFSATFPNGKVEPPPASDCITIPLKKGTSIQLSVETDSSVSWSSADKSIATVSSSGKVTAKKTGYTVITAKYDKLTMKIQIKVTK